MRVSLCAMGVLQAAGVEVGMEAGVDAGVVGVARLGCGGLVLTTSGPGDVLSATLVARGDTRTQSRTPESKASDLPLSRQPLDATGCPGAV